MPHTKEYIDSECAKFKEELEDHLWTNVEHEQKKIDRDIARYVAEHRKKLEAEQ